jgi:hypothetical protein
MLVTWISESEGGYVFKFWMSFKNSEGTISMNDTTVCSCGNVSLKGEQLPYGVYPNIPASERPRLMACRSLLSVQSHCLQVIDLQRTAAKPHSNTCTEFYCTTCSQVFRIFTGCPYTYISKLPECAPFPFSPGRNAGKVLSPVIASLITAAAPNPKMRREHTEDVDFDVMFSGDSDPRVGSYRPHAHLPREILTNPGALPRSYYV